MTAPAPRMWVCGYCWQAYSNHDAPCVHAVEVNQRLAAAEARVAEVEAERDALRRREDVWRIEHRDLRGHIEAAEARAVKAERAVARVVKAARVEHKGPHDTDAKFMRQVANRLGTNYAVGGSHVTEAAKRVMRAVADLLAEPVTDTTEDGER